LADTRHTPDSSGESRAGRTFNRLYLVGIVLALVILIAVFCYFAFARKQLPPGENTPKTGMVLTGESLVSA
jgi:cell division protein FtsN